jgi:hypothetical protein
VRIVGIVGIAIEHRQRDFGQLDGHAEKSDNPHPEDRARSAERNRKSDATDIAEADSARKCRRECLEVIDRARIVGVVVHTPNDGGPVRQGAILREATPDRE